MNQQISRNELKDHEKSLPPQRIYIIKGAPSFILSYSFSVLKENPPVKPTEIYRVARWLNHWTMSEEHETSAFPCGPPALTIARNECSQVMSYSTFLKTGPAKWFLDSTFWTLLSLGSRNLSLDACAESSGVDSLKTKPSIPLRAPATEKRSTGVESNIGDMTSRG